MAEVTLHVYDVTNSGNVRANSAIMNLNKVMRGGIGLGGIFHGAVEVYGKEWSFGYCENGSGVFSCPPKANPMYTYRESVSLGKTELSPLGVQNAIRELMRGWPGSGYDLLSHNCNHFCDEFCGKLGPGVQKLPLWVNRFANAGDAAIEAAENTMERLRNAKKEVLSVTKTAMSFMFGSGSPTSGGTLGSTDSGSNSGRRLSLSIGSPSRLLSRGSPSSSQNGHSGRHSRQSSDSTEQRPILLPWKERALPSSDSSSQSPQTPLDSSSQ
ncbi:hypothetical protein M758_1G300900 [Ceratodon purpureus]|uniref:PPPDE domain-containing protein n=1 Tax=Ceratodon purpureus TaxID=3225 RepID=A0A8T0JE33_CERPU|nr:hypothetical protein KC19_1G307400 [Ceratodon purpureus]KAG0632057.1 hypothetical protein M758_1G300900 [Ceratodon purpureus]